MRNVTTIETPDLFSTLLPGTEQSEPQQEPDRRTDQLTRDFVRWCCSFGSDFRNSPDITNFRFWQQKEGIRPSAAEEDEILTEARRLFLKKVEQAVRKADAAKEPA